MSVLFRMLRKVTAMCYLALSLKKNSLYPTYVKVRGENYMFCLIFYKREVKA